VTEDKQTKIAALAKLLKLPLMAEFKQHISREADFSDNLLRLLEMEVLEKERRSIQRRTKVAGFLLSASWTPSNLIPSVYQI